MQNNAGTLQIDPHKISTVRSSNVLAEGKEKPGCASGATGLQNIGNNTAENYTIAEIMASAFPILATHWGIV